jgi:hypothetical protein
MAKTNANFNMSFNKNEIVELNNGLDHYFPDPSWGVSGQPADYIVKVGQPVGTIWGFVTDGFYKVEDFDFESSHKKQLKSNIYLAIVTRVEPSLQAAFVDFGGNRHGFLPFSEIHPDYFRIPVEDRQALLEAQRLAGVEGEEDGGDDDDGVVMRDEDGNDQPFNGNDGDDDDFDAEDSDENAASANAEEGEDDGAESSSGRPRSPRSQAHGFGGGRIGGSAPQAH